MHQKLIIFHLPWSKLKIYLWYIQNSWMRFFISTWKKCRIFQNISWQIMFTRLEIYCEHLIVLQVCARIKKKKVHALQNLYPIVFILFFYSIKASWYLITLWSIHFLWGLISLSNELQTFYYDYIWPIVDEFFQEQVRKKRLTEIGPIRWF